MLTDRNTNEKQAVWHSQNYRKLEAWCHRKMGITKGSEDSLCKEQIRDAEVPKPSSHSWGTTPFQSPQEPASYSPVHLNWKALKPGTPGKIESLDELPVKNGRFRWKSTVLGNTLALFYPIPSHPQLLNGSS